jgi:2-iminobutanoate/2-iminopropanoate deaminase
VDKELELLFGGFSSALTQAGMGWDDLVWVQVFATDLTLWDRFNQEYVKRFRGDFPARAYLGSAPLLRNGRFEMMGIAVKTT